MPEQQFDSLTIEFGWGGHYFAGQVGFAFHHRILSHAMTRTKKVTPFGRRQIQQWFDARWQSSGG
jgi:hypothetical protein